MNARISLNAEIRKPSLGSPHDPIHAGIEDSADKRDFLTSIIHHGTVAKARALLKERVVNILREAREAESNWERSIIGCQDGTVILVEWSHGSWTHRITGPDRKGSSSTTMGGTFFDALKTARDHAESGYGGIAWETRI